MDHHPVVLELGIQALPIRREEGEPLEGIHVREEKHHQEEDQDHLEDPDHVGHELPVLVPILEDGDGGEERQQHCPEEQGAPLSRPQAGNLEEDVQLTVGVVGYIEVLEAIADECIDDAGRSENEEEEDRVDALLGTEGQVPTLVLPSGESEDHPPQGDGECDPESELTQRCHLANSSGADS